MIYDLEERIFFAVIGLDGEVEGVMSFCSIWVKIDGSGKAAGPLRFRAVYRRLGGQDDLKGARAPLGAGGELAL